MPTDHKQFWAEVERTCPVWVPTIIKKFSRGINNRTDREEFEREAFALYLACDRELWPRKADTGRPLTEGQKISYFQRSVKGLKGKFYNSNAFRDMTALSLFSGPHGDTVRGDGASTIAFAKNPLDADRARRRLSQLQFEVIWFYPHSNSDPDYDPTKQPGAQAIPHETGFHTEADACSWAESEKSKFGVEMDYVVRRVDYAPADEKEPTDDVETRDEIQRIHGYTHDIRIDNTTYETETTDPDVLIDVNGEELDENGNPIDADQAEEVEKDELPEFDDQPAAVDYEVFAESDDVYEATLPDSERIKFTPVTQSITQCGLSDPNSALNTPSTPFSEEEAERTRDYIETLEEVLDSEGDRLLYEKHCVEEKTFRDLSRDPAFSGRSYASLKRDWDALLAKVKKRIEANLSRRRVIRPTAFTGISVFDMAIAPNLNIEDRRFEAVREISARFRIKLDAGHKNRFRVRRGFPGSLSPKHVDNATLYFYKLAPWRLPRGTWRDLNFLYAWDKQGAVGGGRSWVFAEHERKRNYCFNKNCPHGDRINLETNLLIPTGDREALPNETWMRPSLFLDDRWNRKPIYFPLHTENAGGRGQNSAIINCYVCKTGLFGKLCPFCKVKRMLAKYCKGCQPVMVHEDRAVQILLNSNRALKKFVIDEKQGEQIVFIDLRTIVEPAFSELLDKMKFFSVDYYPADGLQRIERLRLGTRKNTLLSVRHFAEWRFVEDSSKPVDDSSRVIEENSHLIVIENAPSGAAVSINLDSEEYLEYSVEKALQPAAALHPSSSSLSLAEQIQRRRRMAEDPCEPEQPEAPDMRSDAERGVIPGMAFQPVEGLSKPRKAWPAGTQVLEREPAVWNPPNFSPRSVEESHGAPINELRCAGAGCLAVFTTTYPLSPKGARYLCRKHSTGRTAQAGTQRGATASAVREAKTPKQNAA